jgi:protocatechuate 3,4-dioxygenase beta subunit
VKEDRQGTDLDLTIRVTRVPDCTPVPDAIVEIWHCDAEGVYSGYPPEIPHDLWKTMLLIGTGRENVAPVNDQQFLRGAQITDAGGRVSFETIFPGWYEPRSPHIHLKILADDRTLFVSQLYFDPELSDRVYLRGPYARHGPSPYRPDNDVAVHEFQDLAGLLLEPRWRDDGPLEASALIGIAG